MVVKKRTAVAKGACLVVKQGAHEFLLLKMKAKVIADISYAAVRNQSNEDGAVQRILNTNRISSIKKFILEGGNLPNAMVLNWVRKDFPLVVSGGYLSIPVKSESAQIIDGQHRIAGIRAAIQDDASIGDMELPVVIYRGLTTQQCADIFLSINTEQKPVPKSLVFDLYGIASDEVIDPAAVRARDIVMFLNEDLESPYYGEIKLPGAPTRKGGIALSTAVTAIKPLVEEKGVFDQIEVFELHMQRQIILNLFNVLQDKYEDEWDSKSNAFMYAAGFSGAIDFLKLKLIPYCNNEGSFSFKTISDALVFGDDGLIDQQELKQLAGKEATRKVYERLVDAFRPAKKKKVLEV